MRLKADLCWGCKESSTPSPGQDVAATNQSMNEDSNYYLKLGHSPNLLCILGHAPTPLPIQRPHMQKQIDTMRQREKHIELKIE